MYLISFIFGKKVFLKVPPRKNKYRKEMLGTFPPEPIIARWKTWLNAALFFANSFEKLLIVIKSLKDDVNPDKCKKSETACTK